ncbi:MAG TPA: Fur family transcriptional regulator [Candidatus Paceibacterota bacterium]|jgi:Fe2+ or Zn2+ uptake regulation protein|nr:Fur family transcriptional regulator [Candidatus Paceibacterota bacterium]
MKTPQAPEMIRRAGFRATKQRVALISYLSSAKRPLLVQEIVEEVQGKNIDQATVYRMIGTFKNKGIVREVNLQGSQPRYELKDEHDHHHIVCTDCGRVEDFTDHAHGKVGARVLARSKTFKRITGHAFDLYGVCKTCVE